MAPLGLGAALSGSIYSGGSAAAIIEDYMWTGQFNGGVTGELRPTPTTYDFHDIWDLDGTDYMLDTATITADEGYWIIDTNGDIEPLDV